MRDLKTFSGGGLDGTAIAKVHALQRWGHRKPCWQAPAGGGGVGGSHAGQRECDTLEGGELGGTVIANA